jgi:methylated-DNA-protein-cysteine methyltransferase-like protein
VQLVRRIPRGKVATYGQIAVLAGNAYASRQVARLLHSLSDKERLPWQRVINSRGTISLPAQAGERQRTLLEREGVQFGLRGRIDLSRYLWLGSGKRAARGAARRAGGRSARRPAGRITKRARGSGTG